MASKITTAILNYDMDFLIHFQRNVIKTCSVECMDPRPLSALHDILRVLEAVEAGAEIHIHGGSWCGYDGEFTNKKQKID